MIYLILALVVVVVVWTARDYAVQAWRLVEGVTEAAKDFWRWLRKSR